MTQHTFLLDLSLRKHLALRIYQWGWKRSNVFQFACQTLRSNEFPVNEELVLWNLIKDDLESRRKSIHRDDYLLEVAHAIDSLENPENYEHTYSFTRIMNLLK